MAFGGLSIGSLVLILGAIGVVGTIIAIVLARYLGVLDAVNTVSGLFNTFIQWIGRVISLAPTFVKVIFFVFTFAIFAGLISDLFVTPTKVCSNGVVWSGGLLDTTFAKMVGSGTRQSLAESKVEDPGMLERFKAWVARTATKDFSELARKAANEKSTWGTFSNTWGDIKEYTADSDIKINDGKKNLNFDPLSFVFFVPANYGFGWFQTSPTEMFDAALKSGATEKEIEMSVFLSKPAKNSAGLIEGSCLAMVTSYDTGQTGFWDSVGRFFGWNAWQNWFATKTGQQRVVLNYKYRFTTYIDKDTGKKYHYFTVVDAYRDGDAKYKGQFLGLKNCMGSTTGQCISTDSRYESYYMSAESIRQLDGDSVQYIEDDSGCVIGMYKSGRELGGSPDSAIDNNGEGGDFSINNRQKFIDKMNQDTNGDAFSVVRAESGAIKYSCTAEDEVYLSVFGFNPFTFSSIMIVTAVATIVWFLRLVGLL